MACEAWDAVSEMASKDGNCFWISETVSVVDLYLTLLNCALWRAAGVTKEAAMPTGARRSCWVC